MFALHSIRFSGFLKCMFLLAMLLSNIFLYQNSWFTENSDQHQLRSEVLRDEKEAKQNSKGMVMCVGNNDDLIGGALYTIELLRHVYMSDLPVSINHCSELSSKTQTLFTKYKNVTVKDICNKETTKRQRKRMKGWFCKTMALVISDFIETIVVDTDVLWIQDPSDFFYAPGYVSTGALFFRDRFLYQPPTESFGLVMETVKQFIEEESNNKVKINATTAKILAESNGINFFWRHAQDSKKYQPLKHVQESSVVIMNKIRLPKTIEVLKRLFETFHLGYGDKEIYWIAATIAQEDFFFEPHLAGAYGDCGEIVHFSPFVTSLINSTVTPLKAIVTPIVIPIVAPIVTPIVTLIVTPLTLITPPVSPLNTLIVTPTLNTQNAQRTISDPISIPVSNTVVSTVSSPISIVTPTSNSLIRSLSNSLSNPVSDPPSSPLSNPPSNPPSNPLSSPNIPLNADTNTIANANAYTNATVYFINAEYLAEEVDVVGEKIQGLISRPIRTSVSTEMFEMDQKTQGRCGGCKNMGCTPVAPEINEAIKNFQRFQLERRTLYTKVKRKIDVFLEKIYK